MNKRVQTAIGLAVAMMQGCSQPGDCEAFRIVDLDDEVAAGYSPREAVDALSGGFTSRPVHWMSGVTESIASMGFEYQDGLVLEVGRCTAGAEGVAIEFAVSVSTDDGLVMDSGASPVLFEALGEVFVGVTLDEVDPSLLPAGVELEEIMVLTRFTPGVGAIDVEFVGRKRKEWVLVGTTTPQGAE